MLPDAPWRKGTSIEGAIITGVSGWEFGALATGLYPPLTPGVRAIPPVQRALLLGVVFGWAVKHFGPWTDP